MPRVWVAVSMGGWSMKAAPGPISLSSDDIGWALSIALDTDATLCRLSSDVVAERSRRMLLRETKSGRRSRNFSDSSSAQGLMLGRCGSIDIAK